MSSRTGESDSELGESIGSVSSDGGDYQDLPIVVDAQGKQVLQEDNSE
jgi:hypothetical protein